jgi:outer membrane protein assembly factor BamB
MKKVPTTVRASKDVIYCLDFATGKTLWKTELAGKWMWYPASSTPRVSGGRCYFLGSAGVAYCLDVKDGGKLWESKPLGAADHSHNRSSSVLLIDGKAVVSSDTALYALDIANGNVLWTAKDGQNRPIVNKEASAVAWRSGDKSYIIFVGAGKPGNLYCIDPSDGKALWAVPCGEMDTGATPAVAGDVAAFTTQTKEVGLAAWRLSAQQPKQLWSVPLKDGYTCPVIYKDHVYAIGGANETYGDKGKGRALCVELETGKVAWDQLIGPEAQMSSPILADGKLIAVAGPWLYLIRAAPEGYQLLGRANLDLPPWASPAFAEGKVLVRTKKNVACYDLSRQ